MQTCASLLILRIFPDGQNPQNACWWPAPKPLKTPPMEVAARFSETLYRGPLAHEVAQADGAVKGQDKRALPAHDRSTVLCNVVAKEEKALCVFLPAKQAKMIVLYRRGQT